ncbi:stalk domain-containing protein [Paenibacillus sp. FSL M8-0228]|uniref:stalk domain-containing protein n=1 Tax=Paenibacillus TaxID=44249 RepID=UPI00083DF638|nr:MULTISPECIES: stalk domain-containing protein [Paenibacillus]MBP1310978.1 hypothetical protein [Paenibacillus sp. 1182]ODB50495.1 hypothetical protein A7311_08240 [Paenibacillus polymyxa]
MAQIAANITKYNKAGGKVLAGLTRRRIAEWALFKNTVADTRDYKTVDKVNVVVNGKGIADVKMIDGKTYVQLRAVGEAWGATVNWNDKTNTATVSK